MKTLISATLLSFVLGTATAFAQAPATPSSPPAKPAKVSPDEKKAISKACSEQADQKSLHGKDRKKFRSACIRNGGKAT